MAKTSRLDQFVANQLEEHTDPEGAVLGNYVIVAELVYPDRVELQIAPSEGTAPWTIKGMMMDALDFCKTSIFLEEFVDDDGEDEVD